MVVRYHCPNNDSTEARFFGRPLCKPLMFARKSAAILLSLAFAAAAASASAVSLGTLTVESRPGEPLNAVLEIDDVDLSVSPLLVRVAPPATYKREGVDWPDEVAGLRIAKDPGRNGIRVRVLGKESVAAGFPLLIELNAGGVVTVREYAIDVRDGAYVVVPAAQRTRMSAETQLPKGEAAVPRAAHSGYTAEPVAPATEKTVEKTAQSEKTAKSEKVSKAPAKRVRRSAPQVVKEYVALNGFSPEEPFTVQRDMTLWSIAKLYWPSYRGATLEQLNAAFAARNPDAFEKGDVSRLIRGAVLQPPSLEAVLAEDPAEAFRAVHGAKTDVPLPTQNLMDAQRVSPVCAEAVANAQDAARGKGASVRAIGEAGAAALAACEKPEATESAESVETTAAAEAAAAAETAAQTAATAAPAEGSGASAEANAVAATEPKPAIEIPSEDELRPKIAVSATAVMPGAEGAANGEKTASADTTGASANEAAADAATADGGAPAQSAADAAPSADTQKTSDEQGAENAAQKPDQANAVDKTAAADKAAAAEAEAFPWAWIALALIVAAILGGLAWTRRSKNDDGHAGAGEEAPKQGTINFAAVEPASEAQLRAVNATVSEAVKNGTTAGAMGAGTVEYVRAQIEAAEAEKSAQPADEAAKAQAVEEQQEPVAQPREAAASAEAQAADATVETAAFKAPADQPWLDPNDDELPPLDAESEPASQAQSAPLDLSAAMAGVSLDLEDADAAGKSSAEREAQGETAEKPADDEADAFEPIASNRYVPPLEPEPIPAPAPLAVEPIGADQARSAKPTERVPEPVLETSGSSAELEKTAEKPAERRPSEKERAQWSAYDGKLKLANSFIGLGALKEAHELLEEVRRHGSDEQRRQAAFLEERIASRL